MGIELPSDIIRLIFRHLDVQDILNVKQVSTQIRHHILSVNPIFWP